MHVAVIGAGSLGRIFGVHLATSGVPTTFVVREQRLAELSPFVIERVGGDRRRRTLAAPVRIARVPEDASAIMLAVRADQIDPALEVALEAAPRVPLLSLTPLLPHAQARVDALVGGRLLVGMPAVAGTLSPAGVVRYVLPPFSATHIESGRGIPPAADALARALSRSGLPTRFVRGTSRRNPAMTIAFFPLTAALAIAGGTESLARDRALSALAIAACRESLDLAQRIGPVDAGAVLVARLAGTTSLAGLIGLVARTAPGAIAYLDEHFGHKLLLQHRVLGREILALAREQGVPTPDLATLLGRVDALVP